ncbi:MAG: OPT/YSL family transporter, partial [Planctomycetota bacterium]|nr:OPT/YSL family transporter [Planctomycetota bacterium]
MPVGQDPPGGREYEPTTPGAPHGSFEETGSPSHPAGPPHSVGGDGLFQRRYREVTVASIIFGVIVGAVMNAAITYAGLKIGFTIVGSSIAAVLGFGVLRGLLRKGSILEVNIGQTIGSAVNTPNSGVIFTVPVLFLLGIPLVDGKTPNENFWLLTLACVAGAILGGAFIVPLRKQMLDIERLRFPSATAVGAILKSPGAGAAKSLLLVLGIVLSALIALPAQFPQIEGEADLSALDELVMEEKITYADKIRTEVMAGWIESESAPEAVLEHGRLLSELRAARQAVDNAEEGADLRPLRAEVRRIEAEVNEAAVEGQAALNAAHEYSAYTVDYVPMLAQTAYDASQGEGEWEALRDTKLGWAAKPLFGYSDLGWRLGREVQEGAPTVDYAYDGLGNENEVLTVESDRDRGGRADLVLQDDRIDIGRLFGLPDEMQLVFAIAPFALGAGYLTGRAGLFGLAGGVLAYLLLNPILFGLGYMPESTTAAQAPGF